MVAVYDIVYDTALHKLIAGTYGRGMLSYSLDSLFQYYQSVTGNDQENKPLTGLDIYPNPVEDYVKVMIPNTNGLQIKIFDLNGKEFQVAWKKEEGQLFINTEYLREGLYLLTVYDINRQLIGTGKFIRL